ncbi:MAG: HIT family protein [Desulfurococcales archaeon]|nr:HIT family protein [Desulfurococcales archaeon]
MCVFCSIVEGKIDSFKVYENKDFIVIMDKYPVSKGHLLIITKDHYNAISETPPYVVAEAFKLAGGIAKFYRKELGVPGVNVIANDGSPAGQEIFHFHVHVIPRWVRVKGLFSGRTVLTRGVAEEVYETLNGLSEYLDKYLS